MLFRRLILASIFSILLSTQLFSQESSCLALTGSIHSAHDATVLAGVNIRIVESDIRFTSNKLGRYVSSCPLGGEYVLELSYLGFETLSRIVALKNSSLKIDLEMSPVQLNLEEVLVEGNALLGSKRLRDLPGSSHILSPKDIQRFEHTDVHKMLASVPGVYIQEEDGYGLRPNIGMRGTGLERSSKITLMEDGVLIAPAPYAASAAYFFPSVGRMHAIELRKGSSQIKFGPRTTGGALNLISTPLPDDLSGKVDWVVGSDQFYQVHANAGTSFKYGAILFETLQHGSDGFKEPDYSGTAGFKKQDYLAKLKLNTSPGASVPQALVLKLALMDEDADESYLGINAFDFTKSPNRRYAASQLDNIQSEHRQVQLQHIARLSNEMNLRTTLYRNEFERDWFKLDYLLDSDGNKIKLDSVLGDSDNPFISLLRGERSSVSESLNLKHNNRAYVSKGVQSALAFVPKSGSMHWLDEAEIGLRLHQDEMDRFQWVDSYTMQSGILNLLELGVPGTESNRIESAKAVSAHLQSRHSFGALTITPGLRYERAELSRMDYGKEDVSRLGLDLSSRSNKIDAWVPGVGLSYVLTPSSNLFAGAHKGFSPPGSSEGSMPESSFNYELGLRKTIASTHYEIVSFFSDYSNLLGSDLAASGGSGTTEQFNGGEASVYGLEALAKKDLGQLSGWRVSLPFDASYTYSVAQFQHQFDSSLEPWGEVNKGDFLPYLPRHKLSIGFGIQSEKWDAFARVNYSSRMRFAAGQEDLTNNNSTDDPILLSLSSSYQITTRFNIFAKVDNLTDQAYIVANRPFGLRPGAPRRGSIGIRARLN